MPLPRSSARPLFVCLAAALAAPGVLAATGPAAARPAAGPSDAETAARLRAAVDRLTDAEADLRALYAAARWAPLWSDAAGPTAAAHAVLGVLAGANAYGLRPADYAPGALRRLAARPEQRAEFDLAVSVAALRLVRALRFGRVEPGAVHPELRPAREPFDAAAAVRTLAAAADPTAARAALAALDPPYAQYRLLLDALARYRALAREAAAAPPERAVLRPGDLGAGAHRLRRQLYLLGDAADTLPGLDGDTARVDPALAEAVRNFQRRHGDHADGVVGPRAHARLARAFDARAAQIALTLERWRWMPRAAVGPRVVVNVPEFRLHAFGAAGDVLRMDVVVGDALASPTPMLRDSVRYLTFAPYWEVPASIAREELVPRARRDRRFLAASGFEVVDGAGRVQPATRAALAAVSAGRARLRQRPGPANSLGQVKFIFPNAHQVYLHDTPARAAFARARRDASHGCVRVADPAQLAAFLLRGQPGWDLGRVQAAMAGGAPLQVDLARPVPVELVYFTAVADSAGRVRFHPDVYGHDRRLARLVDAGPAGTTGPFAAPTTAAPPTHHSRRTRHEERQGDD